MDRRPDHRGQRTRPEPASTSNQPRQNEYFVPRDGIDREVITADICRYLGNDALVRPGNYTDQDQRIIQGYYITAYRNLTTSMIQDLQADSARWEQERRRAQTTAGGREQPRYGGGGYGSRHEQAAPLRYPGNDAPGYSSGQQPAGAASGGHYRDPGYAEPSGYGQATQWSSQAAGMPTAYATGQDRPGGVSFSQHPTGPGVMGQPGRPWEGVDAHLKVSHGTSAHPMTSTSMDLDDNYPYGAPQVQGTYPGSGTQAPPPRQPPTQATYPPGYGQPQTSSAAFGHAQPMDAFYGRTGGSYPVTASSAAALSDPMTSTSGAAAPVGAYAQAKNSPGPYGDDMVMGGTARGQERGSERRVKREYEEPARERNRHRDDERPRDRDRERDRNSKTTYGRR